MLYLWLLKATAEVYVSDGSASTVKRAATARQELVVRGFLRVFLFLPLPQRLMVQPRK